MLWIGLSVGALVVLVVLLPLTVRATMRSKVDQNVPPGYSLPDLRSEIYVELGKLSATLHELEADRQLIRAAVAQGIEHVDRVEARIRSTVKRATKELEEHGLESPGLAAEAGQLSLVHDPGVEEGELPPVREDVGEVASSIPGVSASDLAKVRGL